MTQLETLIEEIPKYQPGADLDVLERAYRFSAASHQGQQRASGPSAHSLERILALGVSAETYENPRVHDPEIEQSVVELEVAGHEVDAFFQHGCLTGEALATLLPNAAVLLRDSAAPSHTALGRYDSARGQVIALRVGREGVMGVRPCVTGQTRA